MLNGPMEIVRCPTHRLAEALSLVLGDLAPSDRRELLKGQLNVGTPPDWANEPLYVALCGDAICGTAWGQRQLGNIAVFWPPKLMPGEQEQTALRLAEAVASALDDTAIEMTQAILPFADTSAVPALRHVGFRHLADLLYLACESDRFPAELPDSGSLEFEVYGDSNDGRLAKVIERTYEDTLDCVGLNGVRSMDDIITGYRGTDVFWRENWLIVHRGGQDVGVLLLADHAQAGHWELMYMGLAPEARGHGYGRLITQHAAWLAEKAGVERIVLAVDATNGPARRMYESTGFEIWDRRTVYVRFPATN